MKKIYRESLPSCDEIFLTEVDANFDGDTFFPEIEWDNWIAIEKREWALAKHHGLRYRFCHFKRKNKSHIFGNVTPFCPIYLPSLSLYDSEQTSNPSKKIIWAHPSPA